MLNIAWARGSAQYKNCRDCCSFELGGKIETKERLKTRRLRNDEWRATANPNRPGQGQPRDV